MFRKQRSSFPGSIFLLFSIKSFNLSGDLPILSGTIPIILESSLFCGVRLFLDPVFPSFRGLLSTSTLNVSIMRNETKQRNTRRLHFIKWTENLGESEGSSLSHPNTNNKTRLPPPSRSTGTIKTSWVPPTNYLIRC